MSMAAKMKDPYSREAFLALIELVAFDLQVAIQNYEMFAPSGHDASLLGYFHGRGLSLELDIVSKALVLNVISALCRIWDDTKDAAGIPLVRKKLRKRRRIAVDPEALDKWLENVAAVEQLEEFRAIHAYRNVALAHRDGPHRTHPRQMSGARVVTHHDERKLLEATIVVVEGLYELLAVNWREDFEKHRVEWRDRSQRFWLAIR